MALVSLWPALEADDPARASIAGYLSRFRFLHPKATGDDLRALGLEPGPEYGRVLTSLRQAWLDGQVKDEAGERSLLEELLRSQTARG
jgi:tRNA nucleotidyltransferase (CCA-adding enzyme)